MTVSSDVLQDLIVKALMGRTAMANNVFTPRTWPTTADEMPCWLVQSPKERKTSLGRSGAPQFEVVTTIRVIGRLAVRAEAGDRGAIAALAALGVVQRQAEVAIINDYDLGRVIQQFATVEVTNGVRKDGEDVFGELVMDFGLEFYQGPEDFARTVASPIEEIAIYLDLLNVFSPTGTFSDTPFADQANPSPRTAGPDGRAEGAILTEIPQ